MSTVRMQPSELVWLYDLGVRFMVSGEKTDGRFALVEHPIRPRALAAPLHIHHDEDEFSYVLEGQVRVQIAIACCKPAPARSSSNPAQCRMRSGMLAILRRACWN